MKLQLNMFLLGVLSSATSSAFIPSHKVTRQEPLRTSTSLNDAKHHYHINGSSYLNLWKSLTKAGTSFAAAAAIFGSALVSDMAVAPAPALADVEISSGAFIIQTAATTKSGDISSSVKIIPPADILPPADWRQVVQDVTSGKVNVLLNGEIVNFSVDPNFSETEDDLIIRVKGFKREPLPEPFHAPIENLRGPAVEPLRAKLAEYHAVRDWLDEPYPTQYLPVGGMQATNGGIILTGATGSMLFIAAWVYYLDQIDQEEAASEAKLAAKAALEEKKKAEEAVKDAEDNMRVENFWWETEQAAKDTDDNMLVESLNAYKKKEAEKSKAGDDDDDGRVNDKKGRRLLWWE